MRLLIALLALVVLASGCMEKAAENTASTTAPEPQQNTIKPVPTGALIALNTCLKAKTPADVTCFWETAKSLNDTGYCEGLDDLSRDPCYWGVGLGLKDPAWCGKIADNETQDACLAGMGRILGDLPLCGKIRDSYLQDQCLENVAISTGNASFCRTLSIEMMDECYWGVAKTTANLALCDMINGTTPANSQYPGIDRYWCYTEVAIASNDTSICDTLRRSSTLSLADECYTTLSAKLSQPDLCGQILDKQKKDECYQAAAIKTTDASLCDNLQTPQGRNYCNTEVAVSLLDKGLCEKIQNDPLKNTCITAVEARLNGTTQNGTAQTG